MTIIRQGGEIIIRIADNVEVSSLQRLINFLKYSELTSESEAEQEKISNLSSQINKHWWEANKDRFLKK